MHLNENNENILFSWVDDNKKIVNVPVPVSEYNKIKNKIEIYLKRVYSTYGYVKFVDNKIKINGHIYETEYISKFINNKKICENIMKMNEIRDNESFIRFMTLNLFEQFNFSGKMFYSNYNTVECTSAKGTRGEIYAKSQFEMWINDLSKNEIIKVNGPKTIKEDVDGLDGSFIFNDKKFTIQIKPFSSIKYVDDDIIIKSGGCMKFDTHYLVLYNEQCINNNKSYDIKILANGLDRNQIKITDSCYITKKSNVRL